MCAPLETSEQQHSDLSLCYHPSFFPQFFYSNNFETYQKVEKVLQHTPTHPSSRFTYYSHYFLYWFISLQIDVPLFPPKPFECKLQTSMTFHLYFLLLHLRNLILNIILSIVQISPDVSKMCLTAFSFFFFNPGLC